MAHLLQAGAGFFCGITSPLPCFVQHFDERPSKDPCRSHDTRDALELCNKVQEHTFVVID